MWRIPYKVVVVPPNPNLDFKIRIVPPSRDVRYAIRSIVPPSTLPWQQTPLPPRAR